MLEGYKMRTSKQRLEWTPELQQQFITCQTIIINCRKLFYINADAPIRVYTDASDYGIGAYLCQVLENGDEVPIEFISKTLTKPERKWSTEITGSTHGVCRRKSTQTQRITLGHTNGSRDHTSYWAIYSSKT